MMLNLHTRKSCAALQLLLLCVCFIPTACRLSLDCCFCCLLFVFKCVCVFFSRLCLSLDVYPVLRYFFSFFFCFAPPFFSIRTGNQPKANTLFFMHITLFFSHTFTFQLVDKPWSQVSFLFPPGSCLQFLSRIGFSNHCSSIFHRVLLTHALALSASQFVHKKKSQRIFTSMHSAGLELTKLTYTRLEDNLIRHRGDRHTGYCLLFVD